MRITRTDLSDTRERAELDDWLEASPTATPFHTIAWNETVRDVFATSLRYIVARDGTDIVGLLPCHVIKDRSGTLRCWSPPRGYEVSYGGPLTLPDVDRAVSSSLVLAASRFVHGSPVLIYNSPLNTAWSYARPWRARVEFETPILDLTPSLDALWEGAVASKRRNMIRKAESRGVVASCAGGQDLEALSALLDPQGSETADHRRSMSYYAGIIDRLGPSDRARLYVARHEGTPLAAAAFVRHNSVCYYWISATRKDVPSLGQSELLQWQAIKWAKECGCSRYDLVGLDRELLPGIATFKLGFTRTTETFTHVVHTGLRGRAKSRVGRLVGRGS